MIFTSLLSLFAFSYTNEIDYVDSIRNYNLDEVNVVSSLKESGTLRQQPSSVTHIGGESLWNKGTAALKGVGYCVPNFYMPDYGSKQTSAIYIRGIGSRIGTPAVGLYVDNVAYYDKSSFDFSFYDVESVDFLRGPQATLYGRNTMGGVIKVRTRSPFDKQGTELLMSYSTKDNRRKVSLTHYHSVSDKFAFSVGGFYDGNDGLFYNSYLNKKQDSSQNAGGRIRAIFKPNQKMNIDFVAGYEYTDEGAYPYYFTGNCNGEDEYSEQIGKITANLLGKYRRGLFNTSLNAEYKYDNYIFNSVTSFQNVSDRMFMDQDFLSTDIYSLLQKQQINTISEEILFKSVGEKKWNTLTGLNLFYQSHNINAPVDFRKDGVAWLNEIANGQAQNHLPQISMGPMLMNFVFSDHIQGDELLFNNDFETPTFGAAMFHQSIISNIFGFKPLSVVLGVRFDYEKMYMNYDSKYNFKHIYSLKGQLTMPGRPDPTIINMVPENVYTRERNILGKISNDYIQLIPKFSLKYDFSAGNVYATLTKGFRSGGYNSQNISEILRSFVQTDIMRDVSDATIPVLDKQAQIPSEVKQKIFLSLESMSQEKSSDISSLCAYKPEYAWNYEVGTHLSFFEHTVNFDASVYMSDVRDLQISRMSETGLGRMITNAGRSRSVGTEFMLHYRPTNCFNLLLSYGYTNASFRDYQVFDSKQQCVDCRGNKVPYMPSSTYNVDLSYKFVLSNCIVKSITLGADISGAGKIYWDEQNRYSQSPYSLLGARSQIELNMIDILFWGRNLSNTKYNTFWFESMSRGFEQHGKPTQFGVDIRLKF